MDEEAVAKVDVEAERARITILEDGLAQSAPDLTAIERHKERCAEYDRKLADLEEATALRDQVLPACCPPLTGCATYDVGALNSMPFNMLQTTGNVSTIWARSGDDCKVQRRGVHRGMVFARCLQSIAKSLKRVDSRTCRSGSS